MKSHMVKTTTMEWLDLQVVTACSKLDTKFVGLVVNFHSRNWKAKIQWKNYGMYHEKNHIKIDF